MGLADIYIYIYIYICLIVSFVNISLVDTSMNDAAINCEGAPMTVGVLEPKATPAMLAPSVQSEPTYIYIYIYIYSSFCFVCAIMG
jgi:hypothetical protein